MSASERTTTRLGALLGDEVSEERIHALAVGTEARIVRRARARAAGRGAALALSAAAVVAVVSLVAFGGARAPDDRADRADTEPTRAPITLASGVPPIAFQARGDAPVVRAFDDASRVTLSHGRLAPIENADGTFTLALSGEHAEAFFEVTPGGTRRWIVRSGPLTVEVLGTRFGVAARGDAHAVWVERGVVRVYGAIVPGGERVLRAGERLEVAPQRDDDVLAAAREEDARAPRASREPARFVRLARTGDHRAAFAELGSEGVSRAAETASPEELLLLADVARLSGHPRDAVPVLERIVEEHPEDPRAPLAAIALARLEMDVLDRPERARRALERARALGVPSALEADVTARLDALGERGASTGAAPGEDRPGEE